MSIMPESQVAVASTPKAISKISGHNQETASHFYCDAALWRSRRIAARRNDWRRSGMHRRPKGGR